jgi:competence protein ComEA
MSLFRLFFAVLVALGFVFTMPVYAAHKTPAKQTVTRVVDINSADVQALETLKGIAVKKAQAIVDYRNKNGAFKSVHDLISVKGISEKFLAKLQKNNPGLIVARHVA